MPKFDIQDADEVGRWFEKGTNKAAERAALATAHRLVNHIVVDVIPSIDPQPVDKGLYRASWRATKIPGGAQVFNTSPQAPFIEFGVRAQNVKIGRAMIDALAAWARRKGIAGANEARSVAWAIAVGMQKKGIFHGGKGLRVLEKASKRVQEFFREELAKEIPRNLR